MRRFMGFVLAAALLVSLTACAGAEADPDKAQESIQVIAMDTVMIFTVYGERSTHAAYEAEDMIRELEDLLSRTDAESQVSAINRAAAEETVAVDEEVRRLLEAAEKYSLATEGAFDMTIAPVVSAWGFTEDSYRVPSRGELTELLSHVGADKLTLDGNTVSHEADVQIDLGGIAKGYASDRVAEIFTENAVPRGWASLGGNVLAWGDRPDGTPWRVGIKNPRHPDEEPFVGLLELKDAYAVTSGSYERFFEENGNTYHHIIDPATGCPADSGLTSVTVVADYAAGQDRGTMCDALSTALFVMGEEKALDFWRNSGYDFDLVLVTEDGRVIVTDGIADVFTAEDESGYTYETVS